MPRVLSLLLLCLAAGAAAETPPMGARSPAQHLSEQEAEEKLSELGEALRLGDYSFMPPSADQAQDAYGLLAFKPRQPPWYTMTLTKRQWLRWQRKAQAWKEDRTLSRMYKDDIERYSGDLRGSQIAAIVDALAVHIQEISPNVFTGFLVNSFLVWEKITRELPIDLRDDTYAYLSDSSRGISGWGQGSESEDLGPDPLGEDDDAAQEAAPAGFLWRRLKPRVQVKANPRFKLDRPGAKLGAGLEWELTESLRLKLSGDYDSKDSDRSVGAVFVLGGSSDQRGSGGKRPKAEPLFAELAGDVAEYEQAVARYKECRGMAYDVTPVRDAEGMLAEYIRKRPKGERIKEAAVLRAEIREKLAQRDFDTARFYLDRSGRPWSALVYVEAVLCEWADTKAYPKALAMLQEILEQDDDSRAAARAQEVLSAVKAGKHVPGHTRCRTLRLTGETSGRM